MFGHLGKDCRAVTTTVTKAKVWKERERQMREAGRVYNNYRHREGIQPMNREKKDMKKDSRAVE